MGGRSLKAVLLDTNAWAWSFSRAHKLSVAASAAIGETDQVFVSPVSFFEIAQKVRLRKWPDMEARIGQLMDVLDEQGSKIVSLDANICLLAGRLEWPQGNRLIV